MVLETRVVSGVVTCLNDNVIKLDGRTIFYPNSNIRAIDISKGSVVTINCFVNAEKKKVYKEYKREK